MKEPGSGRSPRRLTSRPGPQWASRTGNGPVTPPQMKTDGFPWHRARRYSSRQTSRKGTNSHRGSEVHRRPLMAWAVAVAARPACDRKIAGQDLACRCGRRLMLGRSELDSGSASRPQRIFSALIEDPARSPTILGFWSTPACFVGRHMWCKPRKRADSRPIEGCVAFPGSRASYYISVCGMGGECRDWSRALGWKIAGCLRGRSAVDGWAGCGGDCGLGRHAVDAGPQGLADRGGDLHERRGFH